MNAPIARFMFGQWKGAISLTGLCVILAGGSCNSVSATTYQIAQQTLARIPETRTGRLDQNSAVYGGDGSYYEVHSFEGTAGETLTIELTSEEFDAFLLLLAPNGEKIAEDDDGLDGINAQIVISLPVTGAYKIIANSYTADEIGDYQLMWRAATISEQLVYQANQLYQQSTVLEQLGRYAEAIPIAQQSLEIYEEHLGSAHLSTGLILNDLAAMYYEQGLYGDAEPLYARALEIREMQLGPEHYYTAQTQNNLAALYEAMGDYSQAEPLYLKALAVYEEQLGPYHPDTAVIQNNLAEVYRVTGDYSQAESLYLKALATNEAQLGAYHPNIAAIQNNLALLYFLIGRYGEAEPLYARALEINEMQLGPNHPDTATSLNALALLYSSMGRYSEAEPLYRRSLATRETELGETHPGTANSLNNLALLYSLMGRYSEAEPLYRRSLEINEMQLGPNHPYTALSIDNLALLYRSMGRSSEAKPLLERALEIYEMQLGPNHPDTAQSLNNLSLLYSSAGRNSEAESLLMRALAIYEKETRFEHPGMATTLGNLALLYLAMDRDNEAESLFLRALSIEEAQLGSEHPDIATSLNNLSEFYWAQGRLQAALDYLKRGLTVEEIFLSHNLVVGSDANKRDYLATVSDTTDSAISFHLNNFPNNAEATYLALTTLIQRKGRVLDLFTNFRTQLVDDSAAEILFDKLTTVNSQISNLTFNPPPDLALETSQELLKFLRKQSTDLENQLSQSSSEFANLTASPSLKELQLALTPETSLVEFIRYRPFDPTAARTERFGVDHYAVYILTHDGAIKGIDLGSAAPIDTAISNLTRSLASPDTPLFQVKEEAQVLDSLVMAQIRKALGAPRLIQKTGLNMRS